MRNTVVLTAALAAAALAAPAAQAHVTLQPATAAAGAFARLDVRVPNERDDESTEKVEVQLPDGFASASYEPVPGWSVEVTTRQFDPPIQTEDGEISEGVDRIIWTADSEDDAIPPGAFRDFGLSLRIPEEPGEQLVFRALQTYTGGEIVRWIGEEGSDNPAARVTVTEAAADDPAAHGGSGDAAASPTAAATTAAAASTQDDGGGNGLAIVALIVGALGLVVGAAGLVAARRANARSGAAA